jgi:hypothetical protein
MTADQANSRSLRSEHQDQKDGVVGAVRSDRDKASASATDRSVATRLLTAVTWLFPIVIAALLIEVCFEAWIQEILGDRVMSHKGAVGTVPEWPKHLKNGLLLLLVGASVVKVALERRWRDFRTRADLAIVVLGVVLVLAGLTNGSPPPLIGAAVFVYFRGAIVFYAWRAWRPAWSSIRPLLFIGGALVAINVVAAIVQMIGGRRVVTTMGWTDITWTNIHRAQGFFDHPNHLGHVLGIALLGLLAFGADRDRPGWRWWTAFALTALALSASQSRESFLAVLAGAALIWYLRRGGRLNLRRRGATAASGSTQPATDPTASAGAHGAGGRLIAMASAVLVLFFVGYVLARPENLAELQRRLQGVTSAVQTPSGAEACEGMSSEDCIDQGLVSPREIRILYFQQGVTLWERRPLLGYGVGQFGGIVAYQFDPNWASDTRFGPNGFDTHNFSDITVDSFWLHLVVETGTLGLLAYLAWMWFIASPLVRSARRIRDGTRPRPHPATYWAVGTLAICALMAFLSPSLEDPLLPMVMFSVVGIGWAMADPALVAEPAWQRRRPAPAATVRSVDVR